MILPYTLIAGGFLLCLFAFVPIGLSDWLPRGLQFLGGLWAVVVGVALVDLRAAMKETK